MERLFWIYPKVMIANFELVWLNMFVRLYIWPSERLLENLNNYYKAIYIAYVNIK